ncbi:MAG: hypothetical protein HOC79_02015, partial [Euryarchaeota archaeon]|nr:hypothetical protein [Euryarchaeota archaeon]
MQNEHHRRNEMKVNLKNLVVSALVVIALNFVAYAAGGKGACCFDESQCYVITENECIGQDGTYMGDGSLCNADGTCYNAGACCFDPSQCLVLLVQECIENFGTYMGDGSFCNADGTCYNAGAC